MVHKTKFTVVSFDPKDFVLLALDRTLLFEPLLDFFEPDMKLLYALLSLKLGSFH